MTMTTKTEVFRKFLSAYLTTDKTEKRKVFVTVCDVTGMHRKAAMRKFRKLKLRDGSVPVLEMHPDTEPEFISWFVKDWCGEAGVELAPAPLLTILFEAQHI